MAGTPIGPNTAVTGTTAQPPEMVTIPTTGSISATQQPKFSTKGTWQGTRQCSRTQHNGIVSTRRLPGRGPANATPATAAATAWKYLGGYQQQPKGMQYRNQDPLPNNFSYCWSHRYAVSAQHNSMTCMNCVPGHQTNSTGQNTRGSSQAGAHQITL